MILRRLIYKLGYSQNLIMEKSILSRETAAFETGCRLLFRRINMGKANRTSIRLLNERSTPYGS
nr:MAG TPA: hypothetical protein [Caudoviricetes sp.]